MITSEISIIEYLRIDDNIVHAIFLVSLCLVLAKIFSGTKIGILHIPEVSKDKKTILFISGIIGLLFVFFGNIPFFRIDNEDKLPVCLVDLHNGQGSKQIVSWYASSRLGSKDLSVGFSKNKEILSHEHAGMKNVDFDSENEYNTYKIIAQNMFGSCEDSISVVDDDILRCSLKIYSNRSMPRDKYILRWQVFGSEGVLVFINGTEVEQSGSEDFEFTGPNYDRFRLVANLFGKTCQADAIIFGR